MTSKRNRSGQTVTMLFDALNRETSRAVPANTAGYYARTLTTNYDLASRKWALTADGQTLQNGYDTAGRPTSVNDSLLNALGANIGNVSYAYDAASNRTLVNFTAAAGAWGATYNYDAGERLSSVTNGANTLAQYGYDPLSRISTTNYFDSTSVGYFYEADDDVQSITHNFNGGSLVLGYSHNGAHQILSYSISDASYLMKQVGPTTAYTENGLNQYDVVGSSTMSYDTNGNLTGDGVWTYAYDEENRLRQAAGNGTTAVYAYDPSGRRRSKTVNGTVTYFISDGANELAELGSTGSRLRFYVNANGMDNRIGMYDDGLASWRIYHTNHQGSVLFTTAYATSGTILDQYHYGAYGEPATTDAATGNPFRYTGRYLDAETGLYYYRARYYSSKLGRFLQTDPIGTKDDLDLYTYVGNDPLDRTDPTGNTGQCNEQVYKSPCPPEPSIAASAQGQGSAVNDSNFFSPQEAVNGPVYNLNYRDMNDATPSSALGGNYFTAAAVADSMSEVAGGLGTVASFVEATVRSAAEFAHSFGVAGLAFGTGADFISLRNSGISQTQFNLNLGVGAAGVAGGALTALPSAQYFIANWYYNHFYPGGSRQAWQDVGNSLNNMSSNGLGP